MLLDTVDDTENHLTAVNCDHRRSIRRDHRDGRETVDAT
jgi:hypothetical protein